MVPKDPFNTFLEIRRWQHSAHFLSPPPEAGDDSCAEAAESEPLSQPCPCCGGRMIMIETFQRGTSPRYRPAASTAVIRIDTS
jgi:hypothetical protein